MVRGGGKRWTGRLRLLFLWRVLWMIGGGNGGGWGEGGGMNAVGVRDTEVGVVVHGLLLERSGINEVGWFWPWQC